MENRYLHLFDSVQDLNNYITNDYEEPFVALTGGTRLDFNIPLIINNNGHEYVDLGLPSGALWATCNIGSTNPEDIGDYFAFGEVAPKEQYTENNYIYYSSGTYTKYNSTDKLSKLEPQDDAANYNWGGDWYMPTREQLLELYRNTTKTEITVNGKSVYKFESPNGNFIIFPKSGYNTQGYAYYGKYLLLWTSNERAYNDSQWYIVYDLSSATNFDKANGLNCHSVLTPTRAIIS